MKRSENSLTLSTNQQEVIKASTAPLIRESEEEQVKAALASIMLLIGSPISQGLEAKILMNYVMKDLGSYTLDELLIAFKMLIKGRLDVSLSDRYTTLSPALIERTMQSYGRLKREITEQANRLALPEKTRLTPEEFRKQVLDLTIDLFSRYTNGESYLPQEFTENKYDLMESLGILSLSKERKLEIYARAKGQIDHERTDKRDKRERKMGFRLAVEITNEEDLQRVYRQRAKRISLMEFFDGLKEMEMNLTDLIPQDDECN